MKYETVDKKYIDFLENLIIGYAKKIDSTIREIESDAYGPYMSKKTVIDILNLLRDQI